MQTLLSSPFKAVIFDMDNTLFDFVEAMQRGSAAAAEYLGVGTGGELLSYYLRWKHHVEDHMNLQDFMTAHECFSVERYFGAVAAFDEAKLKGLTAYEGIPGLLSALKDAGYLLAVVTDAYTYAADIRLEKTGLNNFFDVRVGYDTTGYSKPHHAPFECALSLLECAPFEAVYVGDSVRRDIEPAMALGFTTVYAKYGDRNFFESKTGYPLPPKALVAEKPGDVLKIMKDTVL
ncbi:MAG: HAD family hydrolase [Methanocorpusculum sp.]|nr:HAD family hydrolase [Methanocorpusculum sp.]